MNIGSAYCTHRFSINPTQEPIAMKLENKEGQTVPSVVFRTRRDHDWVDVPSEDIFRNRTVVVFALPGAFTPTCSSTHVPRYNQLAGELKRHGVDDIVCVSVNDAFVMNEWRTEQKAWNLTFLPDGNGDFTRAMGMLVDKQDLGFGERSWRYSMLVKDGVIVKMFIEPDQPGDPFEVSDADTMLNFIAPQAQKPLDVTVFSREGCPFCARAKGMLRDAGIAFDELVLNRDYEEVTLRAVAGESMVPQVFINGVHVGGSDKLEAYLQARAAA
jgi:glutaredoxin-like protein